MNRSFTSFAIGAALFAFVTGATSTRAHAGTTLFNEIEKKQIVKQYGTKDAYKQARRDAIQSCGEQDLAGDEMKSCVKDKVLAGGPNKIGRLPASNRKNKDNKSKM